MAKGSSAKNVGVGGTARIRLVILEAEAPDGDLSQVTEAVQNALRSRDAVSSTRRAITTIAQKGPPSNDRPETEDALEVEVSDEPHDGSDQTEAAAPPRASRPRKAPKTPNVLDLDMTSGVSFEEFAKPKNPTSDHKRFLVAAAWFKEHRKIDVISADHVYTCYRTIKWPYDIDFGQPLRDLKARQLMEKATAKGYYSINHLGLAEVDKLGG